MPLALNSPIALQPVDSIAVVFIGIDLDGNAVSIQYVRRAAGALVDTPTLALTVAAWDATPGASTKAKAYAAIQATIGGKAAGTVT